MKTAVNNSVKHFLFLVGALITVFILFLRLYKATDVSLKETEQAYESGESINLDQSTQSAALSNFLKSTSLVKDPGEANYLSEHILSCLREDGKGGLISITDLTKQRFKIVLDSAAMSRIAVYPHLMARVRAHEDKLGLSPEVDTAYLHAGSACPPFDGKERKVKVWIRRDIDTRELEDSSVILRVVEHWNELSYDDDGHSSCEGRDSLYAYVKAIGGKATLRLPRKGPNGDRYFSVVPVRRGYEYGSPRGTYRNRGRMTFTQRVMSVTPFEPAVIKAIRDSGSVTVRTPNQFRKTLSTSYLVFALVWILVYAIVYAQASKGRRRSSMWILSVVVALSGIGIYNLFSIPDPLQGPLYGVSQLWKGLVIGSMLLVGGYLVPWTRIYEKGYLANISNTGVQGLGAGVIAVLLTVIMGLFGTGPGGAKVNLEIGGLSLQLAPVIRLCLCYFAAIYFANKQELISAFSLKRDHAGRVRRVKVVSTILIAVVVVVIMQVIVLSDCGGALTTLFSFGVLYSVVRRDTAPALIGIASYVLLLFLTRFVPVHPVFVLLAWTITWVASTSVIKKAIYESAIFLAVIVTAPFCGDLLVDIGLEDAGHRLENRVEMARSPFDNEAAGGDQVALGQWASSSGGLWGTLGDMNCSSQIPAAHTDMVICSLASGSGLVLTLAVIILLGLLVYGSFESGLKSGNPFAYFLCAMIGLGICIQATILTMGALGILPLTGIPFPFLSASGSQLCIDLFTIGIVLRLSGEGNMRQYQLSTSKYAQSSSILVLVCLALLFCVASKMADLTVFHRKATMIRPAYVRNGEGVRIIEYNPLIRKVQEKVIPGSITDRNGVILATSDAESLTSESVLKTYVKMGFDRDDILSQIKHNRRIYPLGAHTLFITGYGERKLLWGDSWRNPAALNIENHCYSQLRGYDNKPTKKQLTSTRHYAPYLPGVSVNDCSVETEYDYSELIPLMMDPSSITAWNENTEDRDIRVTIDAKLQVALNNRTKSFVDDHPDKVTPQTIISAVMIDGTVGDAIISTCCPLPDPDLIAALARDKNYIYRDDIHSGFKAYVDRDPGLTRATPPGSTQKGVTAAAGFRAFGPEYANSRHDPMVYAEEVVDISLGEPVGRVSLKESLVKSSNVGFIKRAAGENLYPQMDSLWWELGMTVGNQTSYVLYPDMPLASRERFKKKVRALGDNAVSTYKEYRSSGVRRRLVDGAFQESWGQGTLSASPIALARFYAACGAHGVLMRPRYLASDTTVVMARLMDQASADTLASYLKAQTAGRFDAFTQNCGGKTGTPQRTFRRGVMNDALYCMYIIGANGHSYGVAIRMERVKANSSLAMEYAKEILLPTLKEFGYI